MTLRIVHLSISPLAGQPYRLVKALRRNSDYEIHLIDLKRWNIYPHDLIFDENKEQCIDLIQRADIIHFHNYLTLDSTTFEYINFKKLFSNGKSFIRQIHSEPSALSKVMGLPVKEIVSYDLPTLVIAQYPERFFPNAYVVRNNLPINDQEYSPTLDKFRWDIFFSPTKRISAWDDRWNTKGAPETYQLMRKLVRQTGCTSKLVTNQPLDTVLRQKKHAYIILDDMVTGSYHLSGLEGLSMAKPTLAYLDERIQYVMSEVSGSKSLPFINTVLENSETVIKYLLDNREEGYAIGQAGRKWLERYWSEDEICNEFFDIYKSLLYDPSLIVRQEGLLLETPQQHFFAITLPDLVYRCRAMKNNKVSNKILDSLKRHIYKLVVFAISIIKKIIFRNE